MSTEGSIQSWPTRRRVLRITAVAGVGLALGGGVLVELLRRARLHRVSVTRTQLGTAVTITVVHPDAGEARATADRVFAEIERLEGIFSRYRANTPVAQLNRQGTVPDAPPELIWVMRRALEYARMTDGAFDPTVAPVLDLYVSRFAATGGVPTGHEVDAALARVGWQGITIDGSSIRLRRPGMAVSLDGIAKGFVVDRGVAVLAAEGAERVIVEAGGDMASAGSERDPLLVAVQHPRTPQGSLGVVQLRGGSLASSGDYVQSFTPDRRFHHIIDPRTGRSPEHTSSTTVKAPSATDADALSTAVFVLGPQAGIALLDRLDGVEGVLVTKDGEVRMSQGFGSLLA